MPRAIIQGLEYENALLFITVTKLSLHYIMNCIFCHYSITNTNTFQTWCKCQTCNTIYRFSLWPPEHVTTISITYLLENRIFNVAIDLVSQSYAILLWNDHHYSNASVLFRSNSLDWFFPSTVPDIISKLNNLIIFI